MAKRTGDPLLLAQAVRRPGATARRRARAGSWLRMVLLLAAIVAAGAWLHALRRDVAAGDFALVRTDLARLDTGPGWVDPRWSEELRYLLAELPDLDPDDRRAVEELGARVAGLPFVRAVGAARVLWPDGLRLELELREPIACIAAGRHYLGVAADGTVLPGRWPTPPPRDAGFLPVIRLPQADELGRELVLRPGTRLDLPAAVDGLAIAASLWRELAPRDLARLGRCVVDARRARLARVEEPGARLLLEGRRTAWLGRSPNLDEPGELPIARKWEHVARALALLEPDAARAERPEGLDWDLLDARWDRADLHERDAADPGDAGR